MKKKLPLWGLRIFSVLCLALLFLPGKWKQESQSDARAFSITRVWVQGVNGDIWKWLKGRASTFEKETGQRVYLRQASPEEMESLSALDENALSPDLALFPGGKNIVALTGYALILRDDSQPVMTSAPTRLLFYPPTPDPSALPSPAPLPAVPKYVSFLCPPEIFSPLPGAAESANILSDFINGKAQAALLTASQAEQLPFGYQAYPVPEGKGFLPLGGAAITEDGEKLLSFLLSEPSQKALANSGLYSPSYSLYPGGDALRSLIESGKKPSSN